MKNRIWLSFVLVVQMVNTALCVLNNQCNATKNANMEDHVASPCHFPFVYKNKTYYGCTYDHSAIVANSMPWCSINTTDEGHHNHDDENANIGICEDKDNCPIPPRYCGMPTIIHQDSNIVNYDITIEQQPWMVSIGRSPLKGGWQHECSGSLVTNRHVLTAAHCFGGKNEPKNEYQMRLGTATISGHLPGIKRTVIEILIHPKYKHPASYFDVGIAIADKIIEFSQTIMPICLPFQPAEENNHLPGNFVNLAGWGNPLINKKFKSNLQVYNLEVSTNEKCKNSLSSSTIEKSGIPLEVVNEKIPQGLINEVACIENTLHVEKSCQGDSGSPGIIAVKKTTKGMFFEQHFILSSAFDCKLPIMMYTRISSRQILNWIQKVTDTFPSLMVVAGGNENFRNSLSSVEILRSGGDSRCAPEINPLIGEDVFFNGSTASSAELEGLTGFFANHAAIVCGGKHLKNESNDCYEFYSTNNSWSKIQSMHYARYSAAASVDNNNNLWVIGGLQKCFNAENSEVYNSGTWTKGVSVPSLLGETSIADQCVVRINSTHLFMAGGLAQTFIPRQTFDGEVIQNINDCLSDLTPHEIYVDGLAGGYILNRAWIFDGKEWEPIANMSVPRDQPVCSLVEMDDGEVGILVTSGCESWCGNVHTPPVLKKTEVYNLKTGKWSEKASVPFSISFGQLQLLEGRPTFLGGFNEDLQKSNDQIFQYRWEEDEWIELPDLHLKTPRYRAAVFQVPKDLFGIC